MAGFTPIIHGIGAAAVDGAQKASDLQNAYVKTFNLLTTGGEKAAEATKNVAKMQAEGKETRVRFFSPDLVRYEKTGKIGGQVCLF